MLWEIFLCSSFEKNVNELHLQGWHFLYLCIWTSFWDSLQTFTRELVILTFLAAANIWAELSRNLLTVDWSWIIQVFYQLKILFWAMKRNNENFGATFSLPHCVLSFMTLPGTLFLVLFSLLLYTHSSKIPSLST